MHTKLPDIELVTLLPWAKPFDGPEWMFEPKYDGFRGLLYGSASGCEIRTRRAHRAERYTDLRERVARVLDGRQAVLDGEIVSLDEKGKPVFRDLLKGRGYLAFAAADFVWLDGQDLRALRALFETARRMDLEGVVAKRAGDPYGPETPWYVIRNPAYRQGEPGRALPERRRTARRDAPSSALIS